MNFTLKNAKSYYSGNLGPKIKAKQYYNSTGTKKNQRSPESLAELTLTPFTV
jgi:hypothetical protein